MKVEVAVIGAGSWGTALAHLFADAGHSVTLWARDPQVVETLTTEHSNPRYLRGLQLNSALKASGDLGAVIGQAKWVVCAIPTQQIKQVFTPHADTLNQKVVINSAKGIERQSLMRVSEIFAGLSPGAQYAVLSGPSFAEEVVKRLPTAVTVAAEDEQLAKEIQKAVTTPYFRLYTSVDVVGVELAGALKNVIALATGVVQGSGLGCNAASAVITRGLAEIARMGQRMGAHPATFLGLAGMGDLVLTCTGPLSRNFRLGRLVGEGESLQTAVATLGGVAEGVFTTDAAHALATRLNVEMPILGEIHAILYQGKTPAEAVISLMSRESKQEKL